MSNEKIKVVVDTNVFLHGMSHRNINSVKILKLIEQRKLQLIFAQDTIGELVWVIKNFVRHNIDDIKTRVIVLQNLMTLFYYGNSVNTLEVTCAEINDDTDEMFLKCAIKGEAEYLISNDLASGMHYVYINGIKILNSEDFIKMYNELCV